MRGAIGRAHRHAGQPQHRQDVGVVPLERHREGDDVEVTDEGLRLERHHRGSRGKLLFQLLFRGKKKALAHDVVVRVEQLIHGLEAEVRHPHVVGVGKCQRHTQPVDVRLPDVADLLREGGLCGFFLLPGVHGC